MNLNQPYHYRLYGLTLQSAIEFPELVAVSASTGEADFTVQRGAVSSEGLDESKRLGPFLWASDDELLLIVPDVARYWVRDGNKIIVDPAEGIDEDSVRVFLLGSCIGALLHQRGYLVLHGNAVQVGDQCIVMVGNSGAGKSTLAAAFLRRGHPILTDDVCAVNDKGEVIPGFPRVKLWHDAAKKLGITTDDLRRIRPAMAKYDLPVAGQFCQMPLPIHAVFILSSHNGDDFRLEQIHGMARFMPLSHHTYRKRYLDGMTPKGHHLKLLGQLAGRIKLFRITRPQTGFQIDALADLVLAHATGAMNVA